MSSNDRTEGDTTPGRTLIERPPPGLARGQYPAPAWAVATLGVTVVLAGVLYLARRRRKRAGR